MKSTNQSTPYPNPFATLQAFTHVIAGMIALAAMTSSLAAQEDRQYTAEEKEAAYKSGVAYKREIDRDPSTWQWNIPLQLPNVTHGTVHSDSMDRDIGYNIFLPPSYKTSSDTRYPVVYYCHGATGSETSDVKLTDHLLADINSKSIGEVIYVFFNAGHFSGYRDRPEDNIMVETYITKELIPAIDNQYRTIATRKGRALMGFSMGGGGSTRLALKHPDMFCAVASFSGAIDQNPDFKEDDNLFKVPPEDNAYYLATKNQEMIRDGVGLYFCVGGEDRLYPRHPPFMEHLHELNIPFNYRVKSGFGHDLWGLMELFGSEAIKFLDSHYTKAQTEE